MVLHQARPSAATQVKAPRDACNVDWIGLAAHLGNASDATRIIEVPRRDLL